MEWLEQRIALSVSDTSPPTSASILNASGLSSNSPDISPVGQLVVFAAIDPQTGRELWVSDGSPAGTSLLADIRPGPEGSDPSEIVEMGSFVFFTADDGHGRQLWKTDGTFAGTAKVSSIGSLDEPVPEGNEPDEDYVQGVYGLTVVGDSLFFTAETIGLERELWKSDGTPGGTALVADIDPGPASGLGGDAWATLTAFNGELLFQASNGAVGFELWKSDGTDSGTRLVKDIAQPQNPEDGNSSMPFYLTPAGEWVYFTTLYRSGNLWKTDGTTEGTTRVVDDLAAYQLTPKGDHLYFVGELQVEPYERDIWRTDGTPSGTMRLRDDDTSIETDLPIEPWNLTYVGDTLFFSASDPQRGKALWKSNGTAAGTELVKDIPDPAASDDWPYYDTLGDFKEAAGRLFFLGHDAGSLSLWTSDGTSAGTVVVAAGVDPSAYPAFSLAALGGAVCTTVTGVAGDTFWRLEWDRPDVPIISQIWPTGGASFRVESIQMQPSGFNASFSGRLDERTLNLYEQPGDFGTADGFRVPDITVTGTVTGPIKGTLDILPDGMGIAFVRSGGALPHDTYTIRLQSGHVGLRSVEGAWLDGDEDGVPGGDYVAEFAVQTPADAIEISLPDFAMGFGQAVDTPAGGGGLPLTLSTGRNVSGLDATLEFDPSLLNVTGFSLSPSLASVGVQAVFNVLSAGRVSLTVFFTSEFSEEDGPLRIGSFTALVPNAAPLGARQRLRFSDAAVFDASPEVAERPIVLDDAVHVVAFLGDASGNGRIQANDAVLVARMAAGVQSGLAAYRWLDPLIVADVSGNGRFQSNDAVLIARRAAGMLVHQIPMPTSGLGISSLQHMMDDVPEAEAPRKQDVFMPGTSLGGLLSRPTGGASATAAETDTGALNAASAASADDMAAKAIALLAPDGTRLQSYDPSLPVPHHVVERAVPLAAFELPAEMIGPSSPSPETTPYSRLADPPSHYARTAETPHVLDAPVARRTVAIDWRPWETLVGRAARNGVANRVAR